jgi:lysine decarboxylase
MNAPLYKKLEQYASGRRISFAMPGHKGGKGMSQGFDRKLLKYDVTELPDTENLHQPGDAMKTAKRLAAEFFEAQDTYFLVGGSTCGIFAMLAATCSPGDTVIVNRACHISVMNACTILGLRPAFIRQDVMETFSIPQGIDQKAVIAALDEHHDAKAVLLTSPSYYGICSDIETIAKMTRARGIPLLVDEAHGAHFAANPSVFPRTALSQGADMVVQSAHKTLNAMNQAAYLHVNSDLIDKARLKAVLPMLETSSPSYLIAASCDLARADLEEKGAAKWETTCRQCEELRRKVQAKTNVQFISMLQNGQNNIESVDETRIVMNFSAYQTTGFDISELLRTKYKIDMEMADLFNVVGIATPANSSSEYMKLSNAVISICAGLSPSEEEPAFPPPPIPELAMAPQEAFYKKGRAVRLDEAVGCVSRATVVAYPPAVPIICTGELVLSQSVDYIEALKGMGAQIVGLSENGFLPVVE